MTSTPKVELALSMNGVTLITNVYGDLQGYNRSRIRREVCCNASRSSAIIVALQSALLQRSIQDAIARFPDYAVKVGGRLRGDREFQIEDLPVWTRQDQRALFASLRGPPVPGAFVHSTGGSTGEPTRFYVTRESYEWRMAIADRGYSWAGAEEGRRSYYIWGSPIKPLSMLKKLRVGIQHWLQNRQYFDSFIFDEAHKASCCRGINEFKPFALVGYAGNLVESALYVRAHPGALKWKARTAVTAAEGLRPGQRKLLQETLADEVFLSYGSREFMLIGMECREHQGYHISADNLYVEVVDEAGRTCAPGQTGRILVTDLRNAANPFIRYEIGDLGAMAAEPCSCGLPFPLLASVEGRIQEYLCAADGSRLTALFIPHLMKEFAWVQGYQIEQEQLGKVRVNVLSDYEPTGAEKAPLITALVEKLGEGSQVEVVRVVALKKGASGKVPIVVR